MIVTWRFPQPSESFLARTAVDLAERGHQVHVVSYSRGDSTMDVGARSDRGARLSVTCAPVEQPRWLKAPLLVRLLGGGIRRNPRLVLAAMGHLARTYGVNRRFWDCLYRLLPLAGQRPDVLHFEWAHQATQQLAFLEVCSYPLIVSCRGSDLRIYPQLDAELALRLPRVLSKAHSVHCVSEELVERTAGYGLDRDRAVVIRPGVDTTLFRPRPESRGTDRRVHIVTVGRVHWVKGHEDTLRALRLLRDRNHGITYSIVGTGQPEEVAHLQVMTQELGLSDVTTFLGEVPPASVPHVLGEADIFVLSSLSEGISIAALEAMSSGLPVVASDVGGMGEAVRDGVDGLLVPPGSPADLARALERLIVDVRLRQRMGNSARQRAIEAFDSRSEIDQFVSLYRKVAGETSNETAES